MRGTPIKPDEYAACWCGSRFVFARCQASEAKTAGQSASKEGTEAQLKAVASSHAFAVDRLIQTCRFFHAGTSLVFKEELRGVHQGPEQVLYSTFSFLGRSPCYRDSSRTGADLFVLWVSRINEQVQFFYDFLC